ncbi:transcriptional regulator, ArsR family [Sulfurimonas gotlandica GD1]|jgi:ArsR family transcriptional regulator|uniref:Transcriptional regulator, ArsR family n=1 Tax=Sulfurimonas gotlandica (strain DSM 19862 / JCM 16533 / GD1) TaxID=929558 RepID=B6BHZ6_SULGG|nr:metalloregulator ArsR/SmtB family transcription factor [Sulfurimonas gotlandica]EDZ63333.1 putative transcriptional regulator, ArsR family [Sulfurimonas gotlandica GD1]EHP30148.1 transcriptional regulator, ArsR family [Sulfurimonas gotlandica GD1]
MLDMNDKIKIFKALGNETRFMIFKNIFTGGYACSIDDSKPKDDIIAQATCVTSIAEHFDFALPTISRHLKELKDAKIITMTKNKNKIYIEPNIETMKEIAGCFNILVEDYEKGVVYQFDNTK